ncbi:hypothetical protein LINPERPRIM_LOCUS13130 [Linum perenne]
MATRVDVVQPCDAASKVHSRGGPSDFIDIGIKQVDSSRPQATSTTMP